MYELNLDFDPTTVGFDPREITNNGDGTYTVTRRFVHAQHHHDVGQMYYDIEAYCPCLTDNVEIYCYEYMDYKGRMTYGISYFTNDGETQNIEGRTLNNSKMDYMYPIGPGLFNRKYDTNIEDKEDERRVGICVAMINGHPNNIDPQALFKNNKIVVGKSAPSSPQEDPFLPEAFKKMLSANG